MLAMVTVLAVRWRNVKCPPSGRGPAGGWRDGEVSRIDGATGGGAGGSGGVSTASTVGAGMVEIASMDGGGDEMCAMA
jgi:hypothetical protein